jgi:hypothetical protein
MDTAMPASHCPNCYYAYDCATDFRGQAVVPKPGDVSICLNCGAANVFADDLTVRSPTEEERASFGLDVVGAQIVIKRRGLFQPRS